MSYSLNQFGWAALVIFQLCIADDLWLKGWHKIAICWLVWAFTNGVQYVFEARVNFDKGRK